MGTEPTGLRAAVQDLGGGEALLPQDAEQLDLLAELGMRAVPDQARGPGRPAGSRNKRTAETAAYLLARYRDPLEGLVQMAGLGVEELARSLGCTLAEAWAEKRLCAIAALPYLHRRQPLAVDLTMRQPVYLTVVDGDAAPAETPANDIVGFVQYQGLSEDGTDAV